jgi:hypothetical protein
MGLLTQKTDLKSLKYGSDRFDGGSSGQPFVKTPIAPSVQGGLSPTFPFGPEALIGQTGGVDQLVRGGFLLPTKLSDDVQRVSKFLITGQGLVFLAKKQGLYIADQIRLYGPDIRKWREVYNPLSPIVNTALAPTGFHLANIFELKGKYSDNIPRENPGIYKEGKTYLLDKNKKAADKKDRADGITIKNLYSSSLDTTLKDTVDFRIVKIDNSGEGNNTYIHFRSYIEGLSDSYTADWGTTKYMGRGENFYFYNGFDRTISFNFKVPILSKYEQQSVYTKLNYLASLCAPDYSSKGGINQGFMRGNLIKLTIGDYLVDVPGIFQGLTYTINDDAGWDIVKKDDGTKMKMNEGDTGGWVMPRLIEVSGFTFKPIHNFIPKTANPDANYETPFISYGSSYINNTSSINGGY